MYSFTQKRLCQWNARKCSSIKKDFNQNGSLSIFIPAFFFRKKGYINFVSKSVRRPSVRLSVCPSVRPSVRPSVTFLVNVSPPKPLEVATSNFVVE